MWSRARAMRTAVVFVVAHPARLVFLAVGSPRQEMLAAAIEATDRASRLGPCIGVRLEFLVGAQRRGPSWMRHADLDWLYRLLQNPRRLARRYLADSPAIPPLLLERLASPMSGAG